ncbi:MAG: HAMP domain-containing histidine kinase [Solirubrobacteraceae bacterium]|nr:HAMP domain-containing histidine kinase [Solirubrobacteraceae bacterium]
MSPVSSIRSAARATFSAPRRWPIRWRLAGGSALLTFVILCAFAVAVGTLTTQRIRNDFDRQVEDAADNLQAIAQPVIVFDQIRQEWVYKGIKVNLNTYGRAQNAVIRVLDGSGSQLGASVGAPDLGIPREGSSEDRGYRVETREVPLSNNGSIFVQYARPLTDVDATINRVKVFLLGGVLSGAGLALLAGLMTARRAMAPITDLTTTARAIERTRDPAMRMPIPEADDEVAELARTLEDMLHALDASRNEQAAALRRQREFVADASHELRTPLTSVLANLELLVDTLDGDRRDAAQSALRSSRRMRRLVADLLLLARADAAREAPHEPTDIGRVVVEAAAELGPVSAGHELELETTPAMVDGARDELHRLVLNLMENAVAHTPEGTHIRAIVHGENGVVTVVVEDDGPGIEPGLRDRVFERFVRGGGDRGGKSSGLGLAIVRAVAESHGGQVSVQSPTMNGDGPAHGTRFVVTLPASSMA